MPPPVPPPAKRRNPRLRLFLAMGAGIAALLCLGGVAVVVSLYDDATQINREAPDAVVDNFLRAYLVARDDQQARLFTCRDNPDLAAIAALRTELVQREREFNVKVVVAWGSLTVTGTGDVRSVITELNISGTVDGRVQSSRDESWTFGLVQDDGWRVCGAAKVG